MFPTLTPSSRWPLFTLFFLGFLFFQPLLGYSQAIRGIVIEEYEEYPVPNAVVLLMQQDSSVLRVTSTDEQGFFFFNGSPKDSLFLNVHQLGYLDRHIGPFSFPENDTLAFTVRLPLQPESLEEVFVEAERVYPALEKKDFYRRSSVRAGTFLTKTDLARFGSISGSEVLKHTSGIRVNAYGEILNQRRGGCKMVVFIDEVNISAYEDPDSESTSFSEVASLLPTTDHILGIEVYYSGNATPPQYTIPGNAGAQAGHSQVGQLAKPRESCGTILIWTEH